MIASPQRARTVSFSVVASDIVHASMRSRAERYATPSSLKPALRRDYERSPADPPGLTNRRLEHMIYMSSETPPGRPDTPRPRGNRLETAGSLQTAGRHTPARHQTWLPRRRPRVYGLSAISYQLLVRSRES